MILGGWPDGDQPTMGKCRLAYVVGLMSSTLRGPRNIIQWTSKFTRKLVRCSLGGKVYVSSEMADHMSMLREFYAHFMDPGPGMVGFEDCESEFTRLKKKITTEKFLIRHFLATRQGLEPQELGNVYWLPGLGIPAGGLTKTKSDMAVPPRPLGSWRV